MAESDVRVPAGWYPDPLGLPQLRWWDNQAWTEHTSEARQPMVAQETVVTQTRLSWADEDRPREDTAPDGASGTPAAQQPAAETLLQLEAPSSRALVAGDLAPEEKFSEFVAAEPADPIAGRFDDLLVDDRWTAPSIVDDAPSAAPAPAFDYAAHVGDLSFASASAAAGTATATATLEPEPLRPAAPVESAPAPVAATATEVVGPRRRRTSTVQAWIIAASPLTFVVVSLFLLTAGGLDVSGAVVVGLSLALPYLGSIPLAAADWWISRRRGLNPPHWLWVMGSPVLYLIVRAIVLTRRTGRGFGPLLGIMGSVIVTFAAILTVPGMVISVNPMGFSHAIEGSVEQQASAFGVQLDVTCPPNPPTIVGSDFTCMAHEKGDSVNGFDVRVSLQRSTGWISWRVDDWGKLSAAHSGLRAAG